MRVVALAFLAVIAAAPVVAQQGAAPQPALVREGVTEKLTQHVWAIPDGSAPLVPNVGIIVGSKAVLVVDTGMGPPNGAIVAQVAAKFAAQRIAVQPAPRLGSSKVHAAIAGLRHLFCPQSERLP